MNIIDVIEYKIKTSSSSLCISQSLGTVGSFHSPTSSAMIFGTAVLAELERLPKWAPYLKPRDCRLTSFADFLGGDPYPKPFKQTLRVRLAFLLLVCLRKRAFDTASKKKASHLHERLCSHNRSEFGRIL